MKEPPVRLCCGTRHAGVVCPDSTVMCCLCFESFPITDLNVTDEGLVEDVCTPCAEHEKALLA